MKKNGWLGWSMGLMMSLAAGQALAAQASATQVRELMDVVGVKTLMMQMNGQMAGAMQQRLPCVPGSYWQGFIDDNSVQQVIDRMVPVYQKHFTAEDIDGLLKFYRSPLGQKLVTEMPQVTAEGAQIGQAWGQERGLQMIAELQQKGTLDTKGQCPATAPQPTAEPAPSKPAPAKTKKKK